MRRPALIASAVIVLLALTACAPSPQPSPSPSVTVTAPAEPSEAPADLVLQPDGTAEDNLPFFARITAEVWASDDRASGRAYIDALVAAGFDKTAMQVTEDYSTVGNAAESMQFSVRWGASCLVGQVGPATGEPVTAVLDVLEDRFCLIGVTRPIDW